MMGAKNLIGINLLKPLISALTPYIASISNCDWTCIKLWE
jgi:hypothetical protein